MTSSATTPSPSPLPLSLPLPLPLLSSSSLTPHRETWTNLCVSTLLDEYEKVFANLGRGHLRLKDWETVAFEVNRHTDGCRTPEQCKGKIESLKKHYRRERLKCSASPCRPSRWVFFNKVRQVVRDPLPQVDALGVGVIAGSCNGEEKKALVGCEDAAKDGCMNGMGFEKQLCERMDLDNAGFQVKTTGFDGRQSRARACDREGAGEGRAGHVAERPVKGHLPKDNPKSGMGNPPIGAQKMSGTSAAAEPVDPPKAHVERATRKSSAKNRELTSLGRDLKEGLSSFAAVIEKIEKTKMELTVLLQRQRLEQDRHHAEMEVERTRLLMRSQLDLAKLICANTRKDCNENNHGHRCSKKGRWEDVFDVTTCRTKVGSKNVEETAVDDGQSDRVGIKLQDARYAGLKVPFPGFRDCKLQSGDQEYMANGSVVGGQTSKGNESTSDGTESFKEDDYDDDDDDDEEEEEDDDGNVNDQIKQEDQNNSTHWDRRLGLLQEEDLNLSATSDFNTEAGQERSKLEL